MDLEFLKNQAARLKEKAAAALQAFHEVNGALQYAENLVAHEEQRLRTEAEKAAAAKAETETAEPAPVTPSEPPTVS